DAAEKRSAEGIQKVAETIADLRADVAGGDVADQATARADIEAAVTEITQRTEDRIGALQRSFDEMVRRLDGATRQAAAPSPVQLPGQASGQSPGPSYGTMLPEAQERVFAGQEPARDELDEEFDAAFADLDDAAAPADAGLDFALDEEEFAEEPNRAAPGYDDDTNDVLAEIREAFGIDPPTPRAAPAELPDEAAGDIADEDLEFDSETASVFDEAPPFIAEQGAPGNTDRAASAPASHAAVSGGGNADFLKSARQAARDAAARDAADIEAGGKRKLTPKQRAILAARAKRRRLEEDAHDREGVAHAAAPLIAEPPLAKTPDAGAASVKARINAAVAKLKANRPPLPDMRMPVGKREPTLDEADAGDAPSPATPNLAGGAAKALAKFRAMPMSGGVIGLGAGIVLLGVALFVLTKDLGAPKSPKVSDAEPALTAPAQDAAPVNGDPVNAGPAPAVRDAAPPEDLVRPRDLYLQNIATLKSSESEAEAKAALTEIEKAAALGHPPAQLQLGELYKIGQIYPKDLASARQWFERAANGGNVLAMHRLGGMAARGEGGTVDPASSIAWFEKASAFGLLDSQYNLGATYHPTTDGSAAGIQNAGLAYYWYAIAAKNGDAQAGELAAGLAATLAPAERAAKDAEVAAWTAQTADPIANELAPAS
ncbi:MAG: tetratricopeptide repeat protein, partial [Parvularculaceae bacterium]